MAGGDLVETWIVFDEAPGDVFGKRWVERECAFVAELEDGVGENGFADGCGFKIVCSSTASFVRAERRPKPRVQ